MPSISQTKKTLKISSIRTFLHILWLRKWFILIIWLALALPSGLLLSLFDLPKSYTVFTLLRFPNVKGAQSSMIRDVAITQRESIISLFQSYQVLLAATDKLKLRVRLNTPDLFRKDVFTGIGYDGELIPGTYVFSFLSKNKMRVSVDYETGYSESFKDSLIGNKVEITGLILEFQPEFIQKKNQKKFTIQVKSEYGAIEALAKKLKIKNLGQVNYKIFLKDRDPWLMAEVLNTLRDEFLRVYYGTTEVQDVSVLVQMENNLELAKDRLSKSQNELDQFYRRNPALFQQDEPEDESRSIAYLNLQSEWALLKDRFQKVENIYWAKPTASQNEEKLFWANELLGAMFRAGEAQAGITRSKLISLQQKKAKLESEFGPGHPKITTVQAEFSRVYKEIEKIYSRFEASFRRQQQNLNQKIVLSKPTRRGRPSVKVELELDRLTTQNKNNEMTYSKLMAAYNRAKLTTGSELFKVNVVDKARPAIYTPPSLQRRLMIAGAMVALLFFLAPALLVLFQIVFTRLWTTDDVIKFTGLKPLGYTVYNKQARTMRAAGTGKGEKPDPMLIFHGEGHTLQDIECYRSLREASRHFFSGPNTNNMTVLITSTRPSEGKSTCAANLGISLARTGRDVLIVDAELRLGIMHTLFNLAPAPGLTELLKMELKDGLDIAAEFDKIILPTSQKNLFVVPRGKGDAAAGELAGTDRFRNLLEVAKKRYSIVLVDTPPLLVAADCLSLVSGVDGVAYMCFSGSTTASEAQEALTAIRERGVKVGVVLNAVHVTPFKHYQYRKYGYYYRANQMISPGEKTHRAEPGEKIKKPSKLEKKLLDQQRKMEKKQAKEKAMAARLKALAEKRQEELQSAAAFNATAADGKSSDAGVTAEFEGFKPGSHQINLNFQGSEKEPESKKDKLDERFKSLRI